MKVFLLFFYAVVVFCQRERYIHGKSKGYPWPLPRKMKSDVSRLCGVSEEIYFDFDSLASCDLMLAAKERAFRYIFGTKYQSSAISHNNYALLSNVIVRLTSRNRKGMPIECQPDAYPEIDMKESYQLQVKCTDNPQAVITADSVWGLLRGIETFSQLIWRDNNGFLTINETHIEDQPAYSWRGVLLDTSRHFLPLSLLLKNLELMAINKMNVFHWHIVDDPSFPWFSQTFPQLSEQGAYFPSSVHTYSPEDIKAILDHGRLLGIRIVPEFDTPGHTQSWGSGMRELLTQCYDENGKPTDRYGAMDVSSPDLWPNLAMIFEEVYKVFPDQYVHLGGDEVSFEFPCWLSNPKVKNLMEKLGLQTGGELQNYYTEQQLKLLDTVTKQKGRYVYWEEVYRNNITLPKDRAIVHAWITNQSIFTEVTKAGLRGIYSKCWYLDHLGDTQDWRNFYKCDPLSFNASTEEQRKLIIGGEACLWGEFADSTNVLPRLWPRASTIAERLWSDLRHKGEVDPQSGLYMAQIITTEIQERLEEHRCRMVGRGFPAQPFVGPGFCDVEFIST